MVQEQLETEDEIQVLDTLEVEEDMENPEEAVEAEETAEETVPPQLIENAIEKYLADKKNRLSLEKMQGASFQYMQSEQQRQYNKLSEEVLKLTEDAFNRKLETMDEDEKIDFLLKERDAWREKFESTLGQFKEDSERLSQGQGQQTIEPRASDPNDPVEITKRILEKDEQFKEYVNDDRLNWNAEFEGQSGEDYLVTMMRRARELSQTHQEVSQPQSNGHNPQRNAPPRMSSGASKVPQDFYELEELAVEKGQEALSTQLTLWNVKLGVCKI
mgnify:CR=1 FL=1